MYTAADTFSKALEYGFTVYRLRALSLEYGLSAVLQHMAHSSISEVVSLTLTHNFIRCNMKLRLRPRYIDECMQVNLYT